MRQGLYYYVPIEGRFVIFRCTHFDGTLYVGRRVPTEPPYPCRRDAWSAVARLNGWKRRLPPEPPPLTTIDPASEYLP